MVEATKLSADKMLQALARDFIIYVEEDCFAHQDLLENFVNSATVYLKKYNKQLLVNTDYMTNARKLIADEKNLRLSLSMLEKMPNFRKVSGKNYEDLTNELRESGDTLFITQDHDRGDTLNTSPLAIDSTNFFVKSIGIGAELENFKDIKPKFVSLGNSPQELTKVKNVVVDLSSLIFSSSSWFFEDLSFIANNSYTIYVCEDEIHDFFAKSSKASLAEKLGNRGHLYSMPDLANRNDKLVMQKVKTMAHIAVLTFNNSRAGEFYCMNDTSGHSIVPFKFENGDISCDFACPWSNDIKSLSNKVLSQLSNSVDNFEKYAEISSKEKQEAKVAEETKTDSLDSFSLSSTTTDNADTLDLTLELNDFGDAKDSIKEVVSQNAQVEKTIEQNIKSEKSKDTLDISIETEAESVLVDIGNDNVVIDPGLAAEKISVTGGNNNLSDSTVDINSLSVEDESFKDFLNSPKLSDFESTSTTTEKKSHKISLFGTKEEPTATTQEVKEEPKPVVSEVKVESKPVITEAKIPETKVESKVDAVVESSLVKGEASPIVETVKESAKEVAPIVVEPIVAETISIDPTPVSTQTTAKTEVAPVEVVTPTQVTDSTEVVAPIEPVKVVEDVAKNVVENVETVVADTQKVEVVQPAPIESSKTETVQPIAVDTTKQEDVKATEPVPVASSSDESKDELQKNEASQKSQKSGDKNSNILANILAKNKQAIEHRAKAAEERANRKPGYLTSSSTGFSLTKKQLKDIEERHRKEALEDKKYEEQTKRQNGEIVDTPTTEASSLDSSTVQTAAPLPTNTSSSTTESQKANESSIGVVESVDIVAAESVSLDIFNDVTSDVIVPSSKSQDDDLSGLVVESTTSQNVVNSSDTPKESAPKDSDVSKVEGTETAKIDADVVEGVSSTKEEAKTEKLKHEPKTFKLQSNSSGGFTLTKEQLEAKAKKKAEEEAKRKEEDEKEAMPRQPKNFKLSGGNAAGFHLTAEQMDKIRKKREEEEKVRQLQKDVESLEKEAAEANQNSQETNKEPKDVKFASQGAGFGLSLEKQMEYDERHRINKRAELEAKKAEYERHKKELEELNREVALIKAIEEYELNGEEGDFVFDPEKDVSVSEIVEIDDFEMTQEKRDLLRKYEVLTRPDVDIKRNLSGTSAHSAEDSRQRGVGALSSHSSNRKTSSVLGFNPSSFSDTPKFEHNVQTNVERPTIDYSAINKVIEEREKAYAENPTVREDVKTTRVHTSETVDIVVSSDNGQKVDIDYKALNSTDNFAPSISVEKISTPFSYTGEAYKADREFGFVKNPNLGDTVYIDGEPVVLNDVVFLTPCWKVFSYGDSKVIRIFGPDVLNANLVAKLVAMQSNVIKLIGIDWPEKLVKNEDGDIVGCVTIKNKHKSMAQICGNVEYYLSTKTRVDVIDIAISYLKQVQRLNDCHVYLGFEDLNSVCIDEHNEVSFCYLERMQVGNYLYVPAPSAIVAPECYEEENICADELSDRFIVADTVFRMMFVGKGPFVYGRHQGVSLDKFGCFRFPINAFDEMVAPKDSSLYIWSFLPSYIKEAFISSLYFGFHKAEERKTCKEWLDLLRRWRTEIQNKTLPPMANEIIPSRMYIGDKDLVEQCKICRAPVEKSSALLTDGLCHHCFNQRGKLVKCACCGKDFMLSYRDSMLNINTKQICEDCKVKDIHVKSIHQCKKCGSSYILTETYERMYKGQSKELCPNCITPIDIIK